MGTIESSRQNSYKTSAQNYVDAIDNAIAAKMAKGEETTNGTFTIVDLNKAYTIETNGKIPTSGSVTISNNKVSTYTFLEEGYAITGSKDGDTSVSKVSGDKIYQDTLLNGADPVLDYGMIPVTIDNDGTVHKADITQEWYNYTNKQWANVVLVSSDVRDKYEKASKGTKLDQSKILAYLVWIPRYRYKLFNVNGAIISPQSIEITFENTNTTKSNGTQNGEYLTHPGFTFGTNELNGFWFGKFELTGNTTTPTILPNTNSLRGQNVSSLWNTIRKFDSDVYGLISDSHMIMNKEWGAVTYLTQSKYGRCTDAGICTEVRRNNASDNYTGYSEVNVATSPWSLNGSTATNQFDVHTNTSVTQPYNTAIGYLASTTGNISGIYDMNGGTWEYAMGVYADSSNNLFSGHSKDANSGYNGLYGTGGSKTDGLSFPNFKYYQTYTDYNKIPNGDAIRETQSWYGDDPYLVYSISPWLIKGGIFDYGTRAGIFSSGSIYGYEWGMYVSSRAVIAPGA